MNATVLVDMTTYRDAVDDLILDLADHVDAGNIRAVEAIVSERLFEPEFADVLAATPRGTTVVLRTLLIEIGAYRPSERSSARDLAALIRIFLLSQIDAFWWGRVSAYHTDLDVLYAPDLVDLADAKLAVGYRRQVSGAVGRLVRAAERRIAPNRTPRTAGLRFTRTRPEVVAFADQVAADLRATAPAGTPPVWVTSLTRSVAHQQHLRTLGYAAMLPSAHCTGYALDIEMEWFRRYDAYDALARILTDRRDAGDVNVIDEGQAFHVCLSPDAMDPLRKHYDTLVGA